MRPVTCRSGADDASSVTEFVGLTIARQANRLGRAKLRLSRGFPARPALRCQPTGMRSVTCRSGADDASSVTEFVGLTIARQAKRLGRAKPYLSLVFGLILPAMSAHRNPKTNRIQKDSWGLTLQGGGDAGSPGSDGASPYLSRFSGSSCLRCRPTGIRKRTDPERFVWVNIAGRGDAGSPGSDGASPYLSRFSGSSCLAMSAHRNPKKNPIQKDSWGLTLQGGATREAPAQTELRPT